MTDFQERVVAEKSELDEKINKLTKFTKTETYSNLEGEERVRLSGQLVAMHTYSNFLNARINSF